jgi:hypothetical protein
MKYKIRKLVMAGLCLFCFLAAYAQTELPIDAASGKILYKNTIEVKGVKKDALYARAVKFATGKYKITSMKKTEGVFSFVGSFIVQYPGATSGLTDKGYVEFVVKLQCKDGKYTYTYTDFKHVGDKGKGNGGKLEADMSECGKLILPKAGWDKIKKDTPDGVQRFTEQLEAAMKGTK